MTNSVTDSAPREDLQGLFAACAQCREVCLRCAGEDFKVVSRLRDCARLALDCATACGALLEVLGRDSAHHGDFARLCAHLADDCARECDKFAGEFEHCRECRDACVRCAEECREHTGEADL